ncbi:MAG TPA: DNA polymerase beta, partial [Planctomycetes bacterium]|nr:DNA polymerase beta [Planctomycetota bacterium]
DQKLLGELVRRIVSAVNPLRIVLFGSSCRGEMRPGSDLDVLVVMPDGTHCRQTTALVYRSLLGLGVPKDILVATPAVIEKHRDNESLVYAHALREGKELYHAET